MASTRIAELAQLVSTNTTKFDEYLRKHELPTPSFDVDGPVTFGISPEAADIEKARTIALESALELVDLLQGPNNLLRPSANGTSLQAIYRFDIASKVPVHGEISFIDLAESCGLYEPDLRRILRYAMIHHRVFCEPRKGLVAHTAASRRLVDSPEMRDGLGLMFDECWQSMARTVDALEQFKGGEPNETGFALAHDTTDTMYAYHDKHPEKARRFAGAMSSFTSSSGAKTPPFLSKAFDWASIGSGTVVDLGGSEGHISITLAELFPSSKFIVQDRAEVVKGAQVKVPSDLTDRVSFLVHDFFKEQPVEADVYLIRWIFHNWPDAYCVKILQKLIPALKPGARIVINDSLIAEPKTMSLIAEKEIRGLDMLMLTLYNSREREKDDWIALLEQADKRFKFVKATSPPGAGMGVIEAVWEA